MLHGLILCATGFPSASGNSDAIGKGSESELVTLPHVTRPNTIPQGENVAEVIMLANWNTLQG